MTRLDWIAVAFVALCALGGLRRGLIGTALALAGLLGGATLGDRLAPHVLSAGARSPYTPVAALVGAVAGAVLLRAVASLIASFARSGLRLLPPLRTLDSIGGLLAGALSGLVVIWVVGAIALQLPGQTGLRRDVQRSQLLRRLNAIVPPGAVLDALNRIDELPALAGPPPPALAPDPRLLADPAVRAAEPSVVRVTAEACGLGVQGSGWVADPHLVVTAAHVVAGADGIRVDGHPASVYAIDRRNDVAVLDVPALSERPLPFRRARPGVPVAILGYPENGPFAARPGRLGATVGVVVAGSLRRATEFSGAVRHGDSGGPVIDGAGVVEATVFAGRVGANAGFGISSDAVAAALSHAHGPVSAGSC